MRRSILHRWRSSPTSQTMFAQWMISQRPKLKSCRRCSFASQRPQPRCFPSPLIAKAFTQSASCVSRMTQLIWSSLREPPCMRVGPTWCRSAGISPEISASCPCGHHSRVPLPRGVFALHPRALTVRLQHAAVPILNHCCRHGPLSTHTPSPPALQHRLPTPGSPVTRCVDSYDGVLHLSHCEGSGGVRSAAAPHISVCFKHKQVEAATVCMSQI